MKGFGVRSGPVRALVGLVWLGVMGGSLMRGVMGDEVTHLFNEAADHYREGRYEEAAKNYRRILELGLESGAVHYNLGNALFQMGKLGPAIVEYERARRLLPRDDDVATNLAYAQSLRLDEVPEEKQSGLGERIFRVTKWLNEGEQIRAVSVAYWGLMVLLLVRMVGKGVVARVGTAYGLWIVGGVGIYLLLAMGYGQYQSARETRVVVVQKEVDVRGGPGETFETVFQVHEGTELKGGEKRGVWLEVKLSSGEEGWVRQDAVERI